MYIRTKYRIPNLQSVIACLLSSNCYIGFSYIRRRLWLSFIINSKYYILTINKWYVNQAYKGVKGKGSVTIVEDPNRTVVEGEKISMKYLSTLDHPIAKMITENSKKGEKVLIKISPKFFSTWDYSKG
ncbi:MAG: hypothetical protein ACM3VV_04295 [Deltaproteobacteria bacterium]